MNMSKECSLSTSEIAHTRVAAAALSGQWSVEAHIDYDYRLSVVLIPEPDHPAIPTFILSGNDAGITAGMIANDELEELGVFPNTDAAMARVRQQLTGQPGRVAAVTAAA
jgi:hypothetical protein